MSLISVEQFSKNKLSWNLPGKSLAFWIGGHLPISNLSQGYHGIMKQWWDYYATGKDVLLVSENNNIKKEFQVLYPKYNFTTVDFYPELINAKQADCDIIADICKRDVLPKNKFDLVINQATLEHVYNPFQAMENLFASLKVGGICVNHTHPPKMPYHSYPRDYFRFMKDWWYDLPKHFPDMELLEFYMYNDYHVFTCYKKIK
ncbi:methyltransferase type 11 [Cotonvirus japonicus]|uniref:Methyltransferase type 11 n=1 Tax=Cotonvirus japonicus TaxID=2811091 RepID=A0ABM7NRB2_9VIRU|nr:methyltransferase type 11 [Cotonvirus japonicus]BCS82636.1 methyltransferase type 11 [Cotonvirus japonicus]